MKRLWISSMEDSAILAGFENLRTGSEFDGLYQSALCRSKADWLVGINATRLFSILYHRKLNVGRVVSPTLALIVQREFEIDALNPEKFYTVGLNFGNFEASSEKFSDKSEAEKIERDCDGKNVTVRSIDRREKSEKPPLLFDLTTLQRTANKEIGYTAQQTLDYLQSLYEKKLCTYPRTDSRFLTNDMAANISALAGISAKVCGAEIPVSMNTSVVCDSSKVSDHHAIVPTASVESADISVLPTGEHEILRLVARQLLCAVGEPFRYVETVVKFECGGHLFTAKGKEVLSRGWKCYLGCNANKESLPELKENAEISLKSAAIKEGFTTPLPHFTEDTLLHVMETASAKEIPEDSEHRGLGTPATRAAILEKLVANGFIERKKSKKTVHLMPTHAAYSLIMVLPEQLRSPKLTAEWEHRLLEIERGEASSDGFISEIGEMMSDLTANYKVVKGAEVLFPSGRDVIGQCPRCGSEVTESRKGFFCENHDCHFALWRDNKFFKMKHMTLMKTQAVELLKSGKVFVKGLYSEKTGKLYDAWVVLDDNGEFIRYRVEFERRSV